MIAHPFRQTLAALHAELTPLRAGEVATYIPELAKADPEHFAIVIATVDGAVHAVGDSDALFTIQSISKPFAYAAALDRFGREKVLTHVGVEPTGEAFNAIVLDEVNHRPFNAMVNAGAIAVSALFDGATRDERAEQMAQALSRFAGRPLDVDTHVFHSEAETGHRNRAIAYLMLNGGMLAAEPDVALDTYFRQCSLMVSARDLAVMAATLANGGINPLTGERAMRTQHVPDVLTVMLTCGMYDYAGQWAYEVGLPAKSGVSGGVLAVVPGQFGIAVYSPRLDRFGNSVRGVAACRRLSQPFALHSFRVRPDSGSAIRRELTGADLRSKRLRSPAERKALDEVGKRILVVETRGDIFAGAAERILRRVGLACDAGQQVILDLKRVTSVDSGSQKLFGDFVGTLAVEGRTIILAHHRESGIAAQLAAFASDGMDGLVLADTLDAALELAENNLLGAGDGETGEVPLSEARLLGGLSAEDFGTLTKAVAPMRLDLPPGRLIVHQGDPADFLYVVAAGSIRVQLPSADGMPVRLASLGAGATFGEMALIDNAPRSADVVAETETVCWALSIPALRAFGQTHPAIMNRVLEHLAADLSDRLRRANASVMALSG